MINQEEANLQREILDLHRKEIGKVREVEQKHNINLNNPNAQQGGYKAVENIPFASNYKFLCWKELTFCRPYNQ